MPAARITDAVTPVCDSPKPRRGNLIISMCLVLMVAGLHAAFWYESDFSFGPESRLANSVAFFLLFLPAVFLWNAAFLFFVFGSKQRHAHVMLWIISAVGIVATATSGIAYIAILFR